MDPSIENDVGFAGNESASDFRQRTQALTRLAASQFGILSRQQLLEAGFGRRLIQSRVESLRLFRIYPGVFSVGSADLTTKAQLVAAVLAGGPCAAISHRTAAAHWGLCHLPGGPLEITRSSSPDNPNTKLEWSPDQFRRRLTIHRSRIFGPDEFEIHKGVRTMTVARTLLDVSAIVDERELDSIYNEAERQNLVEIRQVREMVRRGRGWKGVGKLRRVLDSWDPQSVYTKSDMELAFLAICREHSIPAPSVNILIAGMEVDCLWPERRLIVELDSLRHHRSPRSIERDRAQTIELEDLGFRVLRLSHAMVFKRQSDTAKLVTRRLASSDEPGRLVTH